MKVELETLIDWAGRIANKQKDGHLSIFKFTTNWRVGLSTPMDGETREFIASCIDGKTLEEALIKFIDIHII
jgi:hypothetical protein